MWKLWAWAMGGPLRYKLAMWAVRLGVRHGAAVALASRQAGRLDPRPRVARRSPARHSESGGKKQGKEIRLSGQWLVAESDYTTDH